MMKTIASDAGTVMARTRAPTIVITHTWPDLRNAEYEVLQRLSVAAGNIGATVIAVDNDGRPLWANTDMPLDKDRPLDRSEIDFMISLHFESPRLFDAYSYYALWNPLDIYFSFGYEPSLMKMLSHNDLLSCRSDFADAHGRSAFGARGPLPDGPLPTLFHNVPQPYLEPTISAQSRLFYIGVNWEKSGRAKGRHSGVLEILDSEDILDIYGPRKLLNFEPWAGFASYRDELPFDGRSTVEAINKAGICLALSSDTHKRSGLMSNRLFEGLAAGAAVIVDSNRFARKYFDDAVYYIDDAASELEVAAQVRAIVETIRRDPQAAIERVRRGQARLAEAFSLEGSLQALIEAHPRRLQHYRDTALRSAAVTVVITSVDEDIETVLGAIRQVAGQTLILADIALICDAAFHERHAEAIAAAVQGAVRAIRPFTANLSRIERSPGRPPRQIEPSGPCVAKVLHALEADYFCFLRSDETWFHDHLAGLAGALEREPLAAMAVSGAIVQSDDAAKPARQLDSLALPSSLHRLLDAEDAQGGRFLFRRAVAAKTPLDCLHILDGREPLLIGLVAALQGETAQTGYATYVRDQALTSRLAGSLIPLGEQRQFIRDALAFQSQWLARVATEHLQPAYRGAPRPDQLPHPHGVLRYLESGRMMEGGQDGDGQKFMTDGFSSPDRDGTWVEARQGALAFYLPPERLAPGELELVIYMLGAEQRGTGKAQTCEVFFNGVALGKVELRRYHQRFAFAVPRESLSPDGHNLIKLTHHHAEPMYDNDVLVDGRHLSLFIRRFGLFVRIAAEAGERPRLAPAQAYVGGAGSPVAAALLEGGAVGADGALVLGKAAHLEFHIDRFAPPMRLRLAMSDLSVSKSGELQTVMVSVGGRPTLEAVVAATQTVLQVPLIRDAVDEQGICAVTLQFSRASIDRADAEVSGAISARLDRLEITSAARDRLRPLARRLRSWLRKVRRPG